MSRSGKKTDPVKHFTGVGVALGVCFGTVSGAAFDDVSLGLGLGLAIGVILGAGYGSLKKDKQDSGG